MRRVRNCTLIIAGLDPSSGAGLTADIKTCMLLGVHALGVSSANTIQNDTKFVSVRWENVQLMKDQILLLNERYEWSVVKIGLIQNEVTLGAIVDFLKSLNPDVKIIWDPIISATSGFEFNKWRVEDLKDTLSNLELFTPNKAELEKITSHSNKRFNSEQFLYCNVLVKSYKTENKMIYDYLSMAESDERIEFAQPELESRYLKHGSGCFYSTAIAALLTKDYTLVEAVEEANKLTHQFLLSSENRTAYYSNITQKLIET